MKKFLSLAIVSALVAVMALPGLGGAATETVSVASAGTNSITLNGAFSNGLTFTGITAYASSDTETKNLANATDIVTVVDYTNGLGGATFDGHRVSARLSTLSWAYAGSDVNFGTGAPVATRTSIGASAVRYLLTKTSSGSFSYTALESDVCNTAGTRTPTSRTVKGGASGAQIIVQNTDGTCPGTFSYPFRSVTLTTGTKGLGKGSYTAKGYITLTDGDGA